MGSGLAFRIGAIALSVLLAAFATSTILAESLSSGKLALSSGPATTKAPQAAFADWASQIAPLRGDLRANEALYSAAELLSRKAPQPAASQPTSNARTQASLKYALSLAPYHAKAWLFLSLLRMQRDPADSAAVESLKMSFFTSPNDVDLMPMRINAVTSRAGRLDNDLQELVRGDLRLILTRRPEMKPAIIEAYRHGSSEGKAFLRGAVSSIDPQFADALS
jgi:hypothetical protein